MTNLRNREDREKLREYYASGSNMDYGSGHVSVYYAREASAVIVELLDALEAKEVRADYRIENQGYLTRYGTSTTLNLTQAEVEGVEKLAKACRGTWPRITIEEAKGE